MHFYCTVKFLFFLLFGLKEISSSHRIYLENDITKCLDHWIAQIFTIDTEKAIDLIATIKAHELEEYEHIINEKANRTQFFQNINFQVKEESESDELEPPQLHWKFSEDKMSIRVFYEELHVRIWGTVCKTKGEKFTDFNTFLGIDNFTFTANGTTDKFDESKISYNISSHGHWHWLSDEIDIIWSNENLTHYDEEELARVISQALPKMLQTNINRNSEFALSLYEIFETYNQPHAELVSQNPDFSSNPQKYYYLIPKFPFLCFTLKEIVIFGLSNFDSFKVHKTSPIFTQTLLMKNLTGGMILDYKSTSEKPLELYFEINSLFVSKKYETRCIYVQAKYTSINLAKLSGTLTFRQKEVLMNGLESAIASSILPSAKAGRICDLDTPLEEIKIRNMSDWDEIKQSYRGWIPFNDDEIYPKK